MNKPILIVSILSSVILGCKNQNTEIKETKTTTKHSISS